MKIYNKNINELTTEELEHRRNFLRRNRKDIDRLGFVELSYMRRQEELIINEELLRRGA